MVDLKDTNFTVDYGKIFGKVEHSEKDSVFKRSKTRIE